MCGVGRPSVSGHVPRSGLFLARTFPGWRCRLLPAWRVVSHTMPLSTRLEPAEVSKPQSVPAITRVGSPPVPPSAAERCRSPHVPQQLTGIIHTLATRHRTQHLHKSIRPGKAAGVRRENTPLTPFHDCSILLANSFKDISPSLSERAFAIADFTCEGSVKHNPSRQVLTSSAPERAACFNSGKESKLPLLSLIIRIWTLA